MLRRDGRIAFTMEEISEGVGSFIRSATRNPAVCTSLISSFLIAPSSSVISSAARSRRAVSLAIISPYTV
jgi:hypothetical protein